MKHYVSLIRKSDFTDLFKFGYQYIDPAGAVEFDGSISTLKEDATIKGRLFAKVNQFDHSFEFLVMYFISDLTDGKLRIEEVQNIFALDNEAKREIEITYNQHIRIDDPLWPDVVTGLKSGFILDDAKKGARNIWKILKIEQPLSEVEEIFPDSYIKEIANEVLNADRPDGKLSFWIYLMRYERHGFFPQSSAGYFMDLINVCINTQSGKEKLPERIEGTRIYHKIKEVEKREGLNTMLLIWKALAETSEGGNFFDKVNEIAGIDQDSVIISLLFLIFKDTFREGFNLNTKEKEKLDYAIRNFPKEVNYALYLLGIFLGNRFTYDCLYESLPLPVFKEKVLAKEPLPHEPGTEDGNKQNHFPGDTPVDKENGTETEQQEPVVAKDSEQPKEQSDELPHEQPNEQSEEQLADQPAEHLTEQLDEQPNEKPIEKQDEQQAEQPVELSDEEPADQPAEQPAEHIAEQLNEQPNEKPTEKPDEQHAEQPTEEPTEQPDEQPAEPPTEKPAEKPVEQPIKQSDKRTTKRKAKRAANKQPTEPSTVAPGVIPGLLQDEPPEPTPEAKQHPDSDVKLPKGGKGRKTVKR